MKTLQQKLLKLNENFSEKLNDTINELKAKYSKILEDEDIKFEDIITERILFERKKNDVSNKYEIIQLIIKEFEMKNEIIKNEIRDSLLNNYKEYLTKKDEIIKQLKELNEI